MHDVVIFTVMNRKTSIAVLAAMALSVLLGWRLLAQAPVGNHGHQAGAGTAAADTAQARTHRHDLQPTASTAATASDRPSSPVNHHFLQLIDSVTSTRELDAILLRQARSGSVSAMAALVQLRMRCAQFSTDPAHHPRDQIDASRPAAPVRQQMAALRIMEHYCDRPYARDEVWTEIGDVIARLDDAVAAGDPMARAHRGFHGEADSAILDVLQDTDDPWVAERALEAFAMRDGPIAREIDLEVFPRDLQGPALKGERTLIKLIAARWHACRIGAPCGANQFRELSDCLIWENCALGLPVQAWIQQHALSGRQFELMQRYLEALRRQRESG